MIFTFYPRHLLFGYTGILRFYAGMANAIFQYRGQI